MELSIFPNPSSGNFKIQISKPVSISIYSVTGDLVMQEFELTESRDLNLNLESGIYFVHIKSGDETVTQK
ncbi:MAG: T9SS type A sorting domain-containing protein [Crocinitomicaceae bacterium]|nr:T9SS type A sorting domain-containing protein [Crocinitomicaceae bacterium]